MSRTLQDALRDTFSKLKKFFSPNRNQSEKNNETERQDRDKYNVATSITTSPEVSQCADSDQSVQDNKLPETKHAYFKNTQLVEENTVISQAGDPSPDTKRQEKKQSAPQVQEPATGDTVFPAQFKAASQTSDQQPAPSEKSPPAKPIAKVIKGKPGTSQMSCRVKVTSEILPNPQLIKGARWTGYQAPKQLGAKEQLASTSHDDEREVVIGLDFGTAFTKVVIGDSALGKAFAVPFSDQVGLPAYLLPSRVWLDGEQYTLFERGEAKQRLKLNLIGQKDDTECHSDATAFLTLVIRHARGWLFANHADIYKRTRVLWKLTLGLPAATYENAAIVATFRDAVAAAWRIASSQHAEISRDLVRRVCEEVKRKRQEQAGGAADLDDVVLDVIPELSAQIYGFLMSSKFDPKARNHFLMVDIGAGTVDSSVFKVARDTRRRWEFRFFSNVVQFNGVANLHDARIQFLNNAFKEIGLFDQHESNLSAAAKSVDNINGIPDTLIDYFSGIEFSFHNKKSDPDYYFYNNKFKKQITDSTLRGAQVFFSDKNVFKGMPLFLCGGGSRMPFFNRLKGDLLSHKNASWFKFVPQNLEVPSMLSAKGVRETDFDRLSVAFGLSFLDVGKYVREQLKTTPMVTKTEDSRRCKWCGAIGTCYCD